MVEGKKDAQPVVLHLEAQGRNVMATKTTTKVNQSTKIRRLYARGMTNGAIAKRLGIRYQTVWRTVHRPFKGSVPAEARAALATDSTPTVE